MIFINILESVCLALEEEENAVEMPILGAEHPDCDNCPRQIGQNSCGEYKRCAAWREWFSYEWNGIREAARRLREGERYDTEHR